MASKRSFWSGKRVLVTGATGFVGSWLVKELVEYGAGVIALVRDVDPQSELYRSGGTIEKVGVVNGQLEDFWTLERAINEREVDTIFHLGAQTIVGTAVRLPLPTLEANVRGTWNLLEACRLHPGLVQRIVIASSDKAYGEHEQLPYTEEMPLQGQHPYDVSKSCADLIAQAYYHTYDLPLAIARCGNIYGGGDLNWSRIVPGTIRSVLLNERPVIRSDGTYVRDYIYILDIAEAYLDLAEALDSEQVKGEAFNFSTELNLTVLEMVNKICALMGSDDIESVILNQAKNEIRDQHLSAQKARERLGWSPRYSLEEGLRETIEWYERFLAS